MVTVIHVRVAVRRFQDLREDLRVRPTLAQVVAPRPEVADNARHPAGQRRERLALRVLRHVAVNTEVEMGIYRTGEHQLAFGIYHLISVARREPLPYRRDPAILYPHVRLDHTPTRQDNVPV
jgi:hypothetical protein